MIASVLVRLGVSQLSVAKLRIKLALSSIHMIKPISNVANVPKKQQSPSTNRCGTSLFSLAKVKGVPSSSITAHDVLEQL